MTEPLRQDEEVAEELLHALREEEPETPSNLPYDTIRAVKSLLTARELIDMTTLVFLMRFCVPVLDMVIAIIGGEPEDPRGKRHG